MSAKEKPRVAYFAWSDEQSWNAVLTELNRKGFDCIFQGVDRAVTKQWSAKLGGCSADFAIVDLQEASVENAMSMVQGEPRLKGRIVVVSSVPLSTLAPEGVVFSPPEKIVETILKLHAEFR